MPSQPWRGSHHVGYPPDKPSRLKPVTMGPLDAMGLPSKGETRLNDLAVQEAYLGLINDAMVQFTQASCDEDLAEQMGAVVVSRMATPLPSTKIPWRILFAMRKLREGMVATRRADKTACNFFLSVVRVGIRADSVETYHPALNHLLRTANLRPILSFMELQEALKYHTLDLSCRQGLLQEAYINLSLLSPSDRRGAEEVLHSLTTSNWTRFWSAYGKADGLQRILMDHARARIRSHTVACLQKSYFTAEKSFIERSLAQGWNDTSKTCTAWQLDGETVIIKRQKGR